MSEDSFNLFNKSPSNYRIADNRPHEETKWDIPLINEIMKELENNKYNFELTGFNKSEIKDIF